MGLVVDEHHQLRQLQQPVAVATLDDFCAGDKDKKKKRRSTRRGKQSLYQSGSYCNSVDGQQPEAFNMSFQNASSPLINGESELNSISYSMKYLQLQDGNLDGDLHSVPCSAPIASRELVRSHEEDFIPPEMSEGYSQQKCFDAHLPVDGVNEALKEGKVFKATFRVNAYNKVEAYCTIDGLPTDVLISGIPMQNRAIEGDTVAVKIDKPSLWTRMKGAIGSVPNPDAAEVQNPFVQAVESVDILKEKEKLDTSCGCACVEDINQEMVRTSYDGTSHFHQIEQVNCSDINDYVSSIPGSQGCSIEQNETMHSVEKLCEAAVAFPSKRPTGRVVAIVEPSPRRNTVVGLLNIKQCLSRRERHTKPSRRTKNLLSYSEYLILSPTDSKFPKMVVAVEGLPNHLKKRLDEGDLTLENELVAAKIVAWEENSLLPQASIVQNFGRTGELESHIEAILFENSICCSEFSSDSLSCIPRVPWVIPQVELLSRKDIRNICVFTIDPSTATDLDDALSVERLSDDVYRVGVHIADVSYFVEPDTVLDMEAQLRSTTIYMLRSRLPMLPPLLSDNMASLVPGVDRLAFSIFWDISSSGEIVDRWIGRTVLHSCCKLSYGHAQDIIDKQIDFDNFIAEEAGFPPLYGKFSWQDIVRSVRQLYELSGALRGKRFSDGALVLENSKVEFLLDEEGIPYDSKLSERKESNFLVEEFMLLANRTVAEIISRAYPECSLLRRHPKPIVRKLKELEAFCWKHGLEMDASTSGNLCHSLEKIRNKLKDDTVLYDILLINATKPMQLAKYFCTGDLRVSENEWRHYALAVPFYTHFTSPLRRYPDIIVHRTLAATLEAEETCLEHLSKMGDKNVRGFTGIVFDKCSVESEQAQGALSAAALKHGILCTESLSGLADYCNMKKLTSRHVKDAIDKLYLWVMLKSHGVIFSEARVLALGPRFMSVYVSRISMERRIHYDEVEGLIAEWFESTCTLVLSLSCTSSNSSIYNNNYNNNKRFYRRGFSGKNRALGEVALLVNPLRLSPETNSPTISLGTTEVEPPVLPLTLRLLSSIPVALFAAGGEDGPLDIDAKLCVSSYFG